jgi:hypothetical protein
MESWSCNQAREFGKLAYVAVANMYYCNSSSFHLQEIIVAYTNTSQVLRVSNTWLEHVFVQQEE